MRILIVTPLLPPEPGGPSYLSVGLKHAFEKKGHEVAMVAFQEVRHAPRGLRHLLLLYKVLLQALRCDVLLVLDTMSVAVPAVLGGWLLGKRTVVRTGGDFVWEAYIERTKEKVLFRNFYPTPQTLSRKERMLLFVQKRIVLTLASHITYNTSLQREVWRSAFSIPDNKTSVTENTYPLETRVANGGKDFVCAWRPTTFKNVDTLEGALLKVHEKHASVTVDFLRGVPREEVHMRLLTARALIVPSLTEFGPNLALEALALGVPVLLTKECGMYKELDGYVTWIDPLDSDDIANAMCALLDEKTYQAERKRAQSFSRVRTYDAVADDLLRLV
jgi:glycosyltransferase involved in cell wall biosynthesis